MFGLYILYSVSGDRYYVGASSDPERRLEFHNTLEKGFTSRYRPWSLVYTKKYPTKSEAWKAERRIKKRKSRKYVEAVVRGQVAF